VKRTIIYIGFTLVLFIVLFNCKTNNVESPFLNAQAGKATYVGMNTCKSCHYNIFETYSKTGMGQSWDLANHEKSAADYSAQKALVYDTFKNLYYKPFWEKDSLYIEEFRLYAKDTVHKRKELVKYIVGSGQHTNSHIIERNGYLYQAPITYYTQKGKWDLAPGFEHGKNTRFDRKIELECISCHNAYPSLVEGSINKYTNIPLGIDCERCHGPGSIHVQEKQLGNIVDTAHQTDYTIVNPRKLSTEEQNNICQRCHLQGIAVLQDNKTFFDFLPSNALHATMDVFMPTYQGNENKMIMASHVERMKMSNCYINSGKMSCITCHNPHVSVKYTPQEQYIQACNSCHASKNNCSEKENIRLAKNNNCVTCHMPSNSSIDIPHVAVTDHYIRRKPEKINTQAIANFIGMTCYNHPNPKDRMKARAFLEFFERYEPNKALLDSSFYYLKKAGVDRKTDFDKDIIRTYFLQENYSQIVAIVDASKQKEKLDAWTAYRIGESYLQCKNIPAAIPYYQQAVNETPLHPDFQYKLGFAYLEQNQLAQAQQIFEKILKEDNHHAKANAQLGFIAMQQQNFTRAMEFLKKSILLNPDQLQTLINLAVVLHQLKQDNFIMPVLQKANRLDPSNTQVVAMMKDIQKRK
jgi:hypothetical protein